MTSGRPTKQGFSMTEKIYKTLLVILGTTLTLAFVVIVMPSLLEDFDIIAVVMAGFVNPFSSGFALDAIMCWYVLAVWIWYEAATYKIKHGWICLPIAVAPGVATGFALYLLLRHKQVQTVLNNS